MIQNKKLQLFCEQCHWKRISDGSDLGDLYEYPLSNVPGGAPKLDANYKTVLSKDIKQKRKFRCPQCGRGVTGKIIPDVQKNLNDKLETQKTTEERQKIENDMNLAKRQP